ncbi:MAG: EamA family transporter, partial [Gemmatimonas sp.]|nr:EamA family transporter [Gemmatimonas sp.]
MGTPLQVSTAKSRVLPWWVATGVLTALAMVAFAANSILTRMALGPRLIDAGTFTAVRLLSGAVVLAAMVRATRSSWTFLRPEGLFGPLSLFLYAVPFSFAYVRIGAAAGALVLFGVVQLTMVGWGIVRGERPRLRTWTGLALALAGLGILTVPGATRPDLLGVVLMAVAGVGWGIYSLGGRQARDPLAANARSFLWSVPLAAAVALLFPRSITGASGVYLAIVSGGVTSGIGYAIWYQAL